MNKIILVQPPDPPNTRILRDHMGRFGVKSFKYDLLPPLELASAASLLEKNGFQVEIMDCPATGIKKTELAKKVSKKNPDLIVVNTAGISESNDLEIASELKTATGSLTTVIMPFESFYPENIFDKSIDAAIRGEIEYTILDIARQIPLSKINGITFNNKIKTIKNPDRELIKNLDELPIPAYHLLPMKKYSYWYLPKLPFTTVCTSRGCPFNCIYCLYPVGFGDVWRGKSVKNVIDELTLLKEKYKIKSILFRDQVFNFDLRRTEEICDKIVEKDIDIEWRCEARINLLSKNLMIKMKNAGCIGIHLGVESGDPKLLKNIAKIGLSLSKIKEVFKNAHNIGLSTRAFFIIGLPGETKESIKKTFELARTIKADDYFFNAITPYPGTKLYEIAKKNGWVEENNWENFAVNEAIMRNEKLTKDEIRYFVEAANKEFRKNDMTIRTIFSPRTLRLACYDKKLVMNYLLKKIKSSFSKV